jgi:CheY-like chemotaxis protein
MSTVSRRLPVILMADDDEDDRLLAREALVEAGVPADFAAVPDGERLLDYLYQRGDYAPPAAAAPPALVLLDLNMPRMDGREALRRIRADPALRALPVVVMSTSRAEPDVARGYELGASTVVAKPVTFDGMVAIMRGLGAYWFGIAQLPAGPGGV